MPHIVPPPTPPLPPNSLSECPGDTDIASPMAIINDRQQSQSSGGGKCGYFALIIDTNCVCCPSVASSANKNGAKEDGC